MREQTVSFTGHRPEKIVSPFVENSEEVNAIKLELHNAIVRAVDDGYTTFLCGMAMGVDIWAGEIVLGLKRQFKNLKLIAVVPFPQQANTWPQEWRIRFGNLLEKTDEVIMISDQYDSERFFERNRYLVDHSSRLIAVYNQEKKGGTAYTVRYARQQEVEVDLIAI